MNIYAWLELTEMDDLEGCALWAQLVDGLILSIDPGRTDALTVYRSMIASLPDVRVIPGIKTSPILKHDGFDNVVRWQTLAGLAGQLEPTDGPIVLEHESAIRRYVTGDESDLLPINWRRLRKCIETLGGREAWWLPSMGQKNVERWKSITLWAGRLAEAPTRFIDASISRDSQHIYNTAGAVTLRANLNRVIDTVPIPLLYAITEYWKPEEFPYAVDSVKRIWPDATDVIIYPGRSNFAECARQVRRLQSKTWFNS